MNAGFLKLVVRDEGKSSAGYDSTTATLIIVLLVLAIVALLLTMGLFYMRYRRRIQRENELPLYSKTSATTRSNHRRVSARPSESVFVYQEKQNLIANSSRPSSPSVPEIRITFPEEMSEGKRQSGRVVVVHVGETGVAMEPLSETEKLPSYQQSESDRFQSLDLDRIGGLKEKDVEARWQ